jgi:hypothetical protein
MEQANLVGRLDNVVIRRIARYPMLRSLWLRKVSRAVFGRSSSRKYRRGLRPRTRLNLERLEERTLLSGNVYTVDLSGDAGLGDDGTSNPGQSGGDIRYCIV